MTMLHDMLSVWQLTWLCGQMLFASTVILLLAHALAPALGRASAAMKHRLWCVSLAALLAFPLLSVTLPALASGAWQEWLSFTAQPLVEAKVVDSVPVVHAVNPQPVPILEVPEEQGTPPQFDPPPYPLNSPAEVEAFPFPDPPLSANLTPEAETAEASLPLPPAPASVDLPPNSLVVDWPALLTSLWLTGAIALLLRLVSIHWQAHRVLSRSVPLNDSALTMLSEDLAAEMGLARRIQLRGSTEISVPQVVGLAQPVVLLPSGYGRWDADRLRVVLAHEIAHIARWDLLWQALAQACVCIYWLQPLAWLAARRMRVEREHACDDVVLLLGEKPRNYATHLVEVAAAMSHAQRASSAVVAMAARSEVQDRIVEILKTNKPRHPVSRQAAILLATLAITVTAAAGLLRPASGAGREVVDQLPTPAVEEVKGEFAPEENAVQLSQNSATPVEAVSSPQDDTNVSNSLAEPRYISGHVTYPDGRPAVDAAVVAVYRSERQEFRTDAEGKYRFTLHGDFGSRCHLQIRSLDREWSALVSLVESALTPSSGSGQQVVLEPSRSLRVMAIDATGASIPGATVNFLSGGYEWEPLLTDENGAAEILYPTSRRPSHLYARKSGVGFDLRSYDGLGKPRDLFPADESQPVMLVLDGARTVSLRLVDARTGQPVINADVGPSMVYRDGQQPGHIFSLWNLHAQTDENGVARFDWIPNWTQSTPFDALLRANRYATRVAVAPRADEPNRVDVPMQHLKVLKGRLLHQSGQGAERLMVVAEGHGQPQPVETDAARPRARVMTDAIGNFVMELAPNAAYAITADDRYWTSDLKTVVVDTVIDPEPITLKMQNRTRIFGHVYHVRGGNERQPLSNHEVSLWRYGDTVTGGPLGDFIAQPVIHKTDITRNDQPYEFFVGPGQYKLTGVPNQNPVDFTITDEREKEIDFTIYEKAMPDGDQSFFPNAVPKWTEILPFDLKKSGPQPESVATTTLRQIVKEPVEQAITYSGRVQTADGQPVLSAKVELAGIRFEPPEGSQVSTITNSSGLYQLPLSKGFAAWWGMLHVTSPDRTQVALVPLRRPAQDSLTVVDTIELGPAKRLRIVVHGKDGQPLTDAWVGGVPDDRKWHIVARTATTGEAELLVPVTHAPVQLYAIDSRVGCAAVRLDSVDDALGVRGTDEPITMQLQGAHREVLVRDQQTSNPVFNAQVSFVLVLKMPELTPFPIEYLSPRLATTDFTGKLQFDWLPNSDPLFALRGSAQAFHYSPIDSREYQLAENENSLAISMIRKIKYQGTVTYEDGRPAESFIVRAAGVGPVFQSQRQGSFASDFIVTGSAGKFELELPPYHAYQIVASQNEWVAPVLIRVAMPDKPAEDIHLIARKGTRIFGKIPTELNPEGRALRVSFRQNFPTATISELGEFRPSDLVQAEAIASPEGRFEKYLSPGRYMAYVTGSTTGRELLVTDEEQEIDFTIDSPLAQAGAELPAAVAQAKPPVDRFPPMTAEQQRVIESIRKLVPGEEYIYRGTVTTPDNEPAAGVKVTAFMALSPSVRWRLPKSSPESGTYAEMEAFTSWTITDEQGKYELNVPLQFARVAVISAMTKDEKWIGFAPYGRSLNATDDAAQEIGLLPASKAQVHVTGRQGLPEVFARVGYGVSGHAFYQETRTNERGDALLVFPEALTISRIYAVKADAGFDVRQFHDFGYSTMPVTPDWSQPVQLKLSGARHQTVIVKDEITGAPISGAQVVPLGFLSDTEAGKQMMPVDFGGLEAYTDLEGKAHFNWWPASATPMTVRVHVNAANHELRVISRELDAAGSSIEVRMDPQVKLRGRVRLPDGRPASGARVDARGMGPPREQGQDFSTSVQFTNANVDGTFEMLLTPKQAYLFTARREQLVSTPRVELVMPEPTPRDLELVVNPGTRVFGHVTTGPNHVAIPNTTVQAFQSFPARRFPELNGFDVLHTQQVMVQPDAVGKYEMFLSPGEYTLSGPRELKNVKVKVADGKDQEVNFHTPGPNVQQLTGLVFSSVNHERVYSGTAYGYYKNDYSSPHFQSEIVDGRFSAERKKYPMLLLVKSKSGDLAGGAEIDEKSETVAFSLEPTVTVRGRVLDENGAPLVGASMQYGIRIPLEFPNRYSQFQWVGGGDFRSDSDGRFALKGLIAGQSYDIVLHSKLNSAKQALEIRSLATIPVTASQPEMDIGDLKQKVIEPYVPPTLEERIATAFNKPDDPETRYRNALSDVRLAHLRMLLVFGDPAAESTKEFFRMRYEDSTVRGALDDYWVIPMSLTGEHAAQSRALAARLNIPLDGGELPKFAVIADDESLLTVVDITRFRAKPGEEAILPLLEFLKQHAPKRLDSQKLLGDALEQAQRENKRVFVQSGATWCGPCWALTRFLDREQSIIKQDYIIVKMDLRWESTNRLLEEFQKGEPKGVPWVVILDAAGQPLVTSDGPEGNIGYPAADEPAGIAHFMKMLRETRVRITEEELAHIEQALKTAK